MTQPTTHPDATAQRGGGGRLALAAATVAYAILVIWQAFTLPDTVPGHIGPTGQITNWVSREQHVTFSILLGLGMLAAFLLPGLLTDKLPKDFVNLPHKEFWTRAENWPRAKAMLANDLGWLGAATFVFMTYVMAEVPASRPENLPAAWIFWAVTGLYLAVVVGYSIWMMVGSRWRPPVS